MIEDGGSPGRACSGNVFKLPSMHMEGTLSTTCPYCGVWKSEMLLNLHKKNLRKMPMQALRSIRKTLENSYKALLKPTKNSKHEPRVPRSSDAIASSSPSWKASAQFRPLGDI